MGKARSDPSERRRVGLLFDERMCKHKQPGGYHPENPERIRAIWDNLKASALLQRCVVLNAKEAEDDHLALVHSKEHIDFIKTISSKNLKAMKKCANKYDSIYFNKGSSEAAYLAAGFVIEATEQVAKGELDSAFAIVRPPGHHAEAAEPMGFCLFNNVAIATSVILNERPELGIKKILIVDWDVHHGNSTQKMFYSDPRVLVFSVHRHDSGRFYPEGNDGSYNMVGEGLGAGYNINVPWENGGVGDADYFAVWDHILIPVARELDPDMIIISAGFDAAVDDPIGGCCVSSYGYSIMLYKLLEFARGKIVMALEGGYNPVSLAKSTQACIEMLLDYKPSIRSLEDLPLEPTWPLIQAVRQALCIYWPILASEIPDEVINSRSFQIEVDVEMRQHEVAARIPIELEFARVSGGETYFEEMDFKHFISLSDDEYQEEVDENLEVIPTEPAPRTSEPLEQPQSPQIQSLPITVQTPAEPTSTQPTDLSTSSKPSSSTPQHIPTTSIPTVQSPQIPKPSYFFLENIQTHFPPPQTPSEETLTSFDSSQKDDDSDDSLASAFSSIFKKLDNKMEAKLKKMLKKKTKEIVKAVTETMITKMKIAEVNIVNNLSTLTNTSLAEKLRGLEEELRKLKDEVAKSNEIVLNKIAFNKSNYRAQCTSLEAQLKSLSDAVKKREREQKEMKTALTVDLEEMKTALTADLEEMKKEVSVMADDLAALQLRVSKIEEIFRQKAKDKAKAAEEPPQSEVVPKAAKAKGKREANYSNLSESQIKRIKEEKRMYGERE